MRRDGLRSGEEAGESRRSDGASGAEVLRG